MKYVFFFIFILTTSHSKRSGINFRPVEDIQFHRHTKSAIEQYLSDEELNEIFPISDFFYSSTRFWFLIYTYFDDQKLVIHDRGNLNLVYQIQDFSSLGAKNVHPYAQSYIQEEFITKKLTHIREQLALLANDPLSRDPELLSLYNRIARSGIDLGKSAKDRSLIFKRLSQNVRYQRGLKNHIEDGLTRYNQYHLFLDRYFQDKGLPKELIAISFLESSFNPSAHSKSRAAGVWQFMPFLQNSFFPKHNNIDYRLSIGISSTAAASLLKENFQILKNWDLAVTAYNSGIKHIIKEKRNNPSLTLEDLIHESEYSSFGFASKNFYAEFLALTRVLKFRDKLFPTTQGVHAIKELNFYFAKCDINFPKKERSELLLLNHHLKNFKRIPKFTLLTSESELPSRHFQKISRKDLLNKKPKLWIDAKKRYSCSTR